MFPRSSCLLLWSHFLSSSFLLLFLPPGPVPPSIVQLYQPERNQDWCIPFTVTGNPKPELRWYHEGRLLEEHQYIRTEIHDITDTEYHGCLQLVIPTHIHNGVYTLVASNEFGEASGNVTAHFMLMPDVDHSGTGGLGFSWVSWMLHPAPGGRRCVMFTSDPDLTQIPVNFY